MRPGHFPSVINMYPILKGGGIVSPSIFLLSSSPSFVNSPVIFTEQVTLLAECAEQHKEFIETHAQVMNQAVDSKTVSAQSPWKNLVQGQKTQMPPRVSRSWK